MSDFKSRLSDEKQELDNKIEKLTAFIGGDNFSAIDEKQQVLLTQQLPVMKQYSDILTERIDLLN